MAFFTLIEGLEKGGKGRGGRVGVANVKISKHNSWFTVNCDRIMLNMALFVLSTEKDFLPLHVRPCHVHTCNCNIISPFIG